MKNLFQRLTLIVCLLVPGILLAQFETAEVLGTVHDASGKVIPKASVTLTNQGTGIETKTTSGEDGDYDFFNVKPGLYTIAIEATGFSKFSTKDVKVEVNARQRVDASLQVGSVSDVVTVSDQASVVETDTSERSQVISTQAIAELPLNGRQYSSLALLGTNVHVSPIAAAFSPSATPREGAFNVNGMRSTYNNFLMDGLDNNSYGTSNQNYSSQVVQPSPDAISEFRVITSNFSAEYGRSGGAIVSAVLRSGSNEFHASLWEFFRNSGLNAIGFFRRLRRLSANTGLREFLLRAQRQRSPRHPSSNRGESAYRRHLHRGNHHPCFANQPIRGRRPCRAPARREYHPRQQYPVPYPAPRLQR